MKKGGLWIVLVVMIVTLSGCSVSTIKERIEQWVNRVMHRDQINEQWFEVNRKFLLDALFAETWYMDLNRTWLTAIPNVCGLLTLEEASMVQILSLANNKIRVVNQDLSCLTNLRVLNLSYNEIVDVVTIGDLPALQELLLHKNKITKTETIGNMNLPSLNRLSLAYNNIKEVTNLGNLQSLIVLELQHNVIERMVGIENLDRLQELKVEFNRLTDLPFLDQLQNLKSITTAGNTLAETIENKAKEIQARFMQSRTPEPTMGEIVVDVAE